MRFFWPCLYGLLACIAYAVRVNLHGRKLFLASLGGALGWFTYLMFGFTGYELVQYFMSAVAISIYAEIMARVNKAPVTGFLLVSMLPMVPGGGIYHTMESAVAGNVDQFIRRGLYTFAIAGALAIGVLVVSSIMHLSQSGKPPRHFGGTAGGVPRGGRSGHSPDAPRGASRHAGAAEGFGKVYRAGWKIA